MDRIVWGFLVLCTGFALGSYYNAAIGKTEQTKQLSIANCLSMKGDYRHREYTGGYKLIGNTLYCKDKTGSLHKFRNKGETK